MFVIVMCLVLLMCTVTIWSDVLCALMVEGASLVVNVMLSLMSVMSPSPALCNLSVRTVVKLCTLGAFALWVSLVSWIVMIYACVSWISSLILVHQCFTLQNYIYFFSIIQHVMYFLPFIYLSGAIYICFWIPCLMYLWHLYNFHHH